MVCMRFALVGKKNERSFASYGGEAKALYRQREKERESSIVEEFYEINIAIHRHTYIKYLYPLISLLTIVLLSFSITLSSSALSLAVFGGR